MTDNSDDARTTYGLGAAPGALDVVALAGVTFTGLDGTDGDDVLVIDGDSDNDATADTVGAAFGNDGADSITLDTFPQSAVTVFGGDGADTFAINQTLDGSLSSGFTLNIGDFERGTDTINLSGLGYHQFDQLLISAVDTGSDYLSTITLDWIDGFDSTGLTIQVVHDDASLLAASDFTFGSTDNSTTRGQFELSTTVPSVVTTSVFNGDQYVIDGTAGNDTFNHTSGEVNALTMNAGNDVVEISALNASGDVTIYGGSGDDTISAGQEIKTAIAGGTAYVVRIKDFDAGDDIIDLSELGYTSFSELNVVVSSATSVTVNLLLTEAFDGRTLAFVLENDSAVGTVDADNFTFASTTVEEVSEGTTGDDSVVGDASEASTLRGGNGSDTISGGTGNDTIYGGDDVADTDDSADTISAGSGNDLAFGNSGNDDINMGAGNDNAYGGVGQDTIDGGDGSDLLAGGGGIAHPEDEADNISGGTGDDIILGNGDNDTLAGGTGDDWILGGLGNDNISGDDGEDILTGQTGNDTLAGGNDADVFLFWESNGNDTISDFNVAEDTIEIWNALPTGIDSFAELSALQIGDDVVLNLGDSNSITVEDVTIANLESRVNFSDVFTNFFADFLQDYNNAAVDF